MEIRHLIEQCRQGDEEALGTLYTTYAKRMKGICQRYVSDPQAVDDVLHDAFVVIFTSFHKLRNEDKAEAWMTSIVRNVAVKYGKKLKSVKTLSQEDLTEEELAVVAETDSSEHQASFEELMQIVDQLPEGYGKVFRLSVFEGMSHKEIAELLGIEPHSSSSQLTRAKKMMRKMIKQLWLWLLIPLLIPTILIIIYNKQISKNQKSTEFAKKADITADIKKEVMTALSENTMSSTKATTPSEESSIAKLSRSHMQLSLADSLHSVIVSGSDTVASPDKMQQKNVSLISSNEPSESVSDTLFDLSLTFPKIKLPKHKSVFQKNKKSSRPNDWNLAFAYNGSIQNDKIRTNDYMYIPSFSNASTRSTKVYNWEEYMEYVIENAPAMDSVSAANMYRVALINSNNPKDPLTEKSKHERPLTLQLLFNREFTHKWSATTGLSLTRMKSTFESGNENTFIYRTQRIQYLGIPLKANFRIIENKRMSIYTSACTQLDFPICARLTTKYLYNYALEPLDVSPNITENIQVPIQLSFGVGIGIQYQVLPHINIFLEPSLNYYVPNGQEVQTYRTEHPFDLSIPIGIKISW